MILLVFLAVLAVSVAVALVDWRRGWLLAMLCGVLQDPARKLTPGTPVVMTMSVVIIYAVILFAGQRSIQNAWTDFMRRFPRVYLNAMVFLLFLVLAAINGLATYGLGFWKVPALSLFIYCIPLPAVLLGYAYLQREEQLTNLFRFYATLTAIALIGTPLEFMKVKWAALGLVGMPEGYVRHLPGIQIRILSGFYRAPDVMGWHAAMLTIIGVVMAIRAGVLQKAWPWIALSAWGFLNCLISGRRKAVYMIAVFALAFLWRYIRRLKPAQVIAFVIIGAAMAGVMHEIGSSEESRVYATGTVTSRTEIFERLEGGLIATVQQFGFMGAGLGTATQGVRHLLGRDDNIGWQEGGLGKLAVELGVPGLFAAALLAYALIRTLFKIASYGDVEGSTQLLRAALFGITVANVVNFMVSAQAYSDALLTLTTAFLVGCLFGTSTLDEKLVKQPQAQGALVPATA